MNSCLVFAPNVCARLTFDFPIWEVLATVLVTAIVTFLTIRWSIKGAQKQTLQAIQASLKAEGRARKERQIEAAATIARAEQRERATLAHSLMAAVHDMDLVRELAKNDVHRLSVEANWNALQTSFEATAIAGADRLYEYADLRIDEARRINVQPDKTLKFIETFLATRFSHDIRLATMGWLKTGALPMNISTELVKLRRARDDRVAKQRDDLMRAVLDDSVEISRQEGDIFGEE